MLSRLDVVCPCDTPGSATTCKNYFAVSGRRLVVVWPSSGRRLAVVWSSSGRRLVVVWPSLDKGKLHNNEKRLTCLARTFL
uniref:Transposase n=1 Tax=Peronospora matthiolae TaxID=2874970 RepID=A0AAV1TEJ7_9STRA